MKQTILIEKGKETQIFKYPCIYAIIKCYNSDVAISFDWNGKYATLTAGDSIIEVDGEWSFERKK